MASFSYDYNNLYIFLNFNVGMDKRVVLVTKMNHSKSKEIIEEYKKYSK